MDVLAPLKKTSCPSEILGFSKFFAGLALLNPLVKFPNFGATKFSITTSHQNNYFY
jgi:hypothetical protein